MQLLSGERRADAPGGSGVLRLVTVTADQELDLIHETLIPHPRQDAQTGKPLPCWPALHITSGQPATATTSASGSRCRGQALARQRRIRPLAEPAPTGGIGALPAAAAGPRQPGGLPALERPRRRDRGNLLLVLLELRWGAARKGLVDSTE